ncbi:glycosyltransferase family 4 protein [Hymenobacter latericus]|uniref:glycosyltransferase family 4 protein n=1 Tax=Hymenobacter sp. YIM 151858-1 TaxID=2987688 RepID=UPI0022262E05|nr:glycosyltransferase family 4 protein [Hymenobacter sp. YIM 151858-1]UYZ57451.1 glycosyltransferase family 4 protein [Hymenobacter sp. YIM 151858-1]
MLSLPKLRIGFLTSTDPLDRRSWSGVHYSMFRALERTFGDVTALGPVPMVWPLRIGDNINRRVIKPLTGKRYHYSWGIILSHLYKRKFEQRLKHEQFDLLVAPAAFTEIAYLDVNTPIVYCEDSTLSQLIDFYPGLSELLDISKKELNYIEKRALNKAALVCYSSAWAARSAYEDYGIDTSKIAVIPFGSNYPNPPATGADVKVDIPTETCRLFFLGGEWKRKGGKIAYDTMVTLNAMGLKTTLTVVGCRPPAEEAHLYQHPGFATLPYLNMDSPGDLQRLDDLFRSAHFFLLPSRAECAAIAFADANAFGLPVVTTDVGGISSFVVEGESGVMLPLSATGSDFATAIFEIFNDKQRYARMRIGARSRYETTLNWDKWAQGLLTELAKRSIIKQPDQFCASTST